MKHLKILGLVVAAATAPILFGAGSASATVLCKITSTPCGAANHYPEKTAIELKLAASTKSVIVSTDGAVEDACSETKLEGETSNTGGATATIEVPVAPFQLTFGNCSHTTKVILGGTLEIHNIMGSDNGQITDSELRIEIKVLGMECDYRPAAGTAIGTLFGPTNTVNVNTVLTLVSGNELVCPSDVKWTATYNLTLPAKAVYVEPS